jgi:hypothetical protein
MVLSNRIHEKIYWTLIDKIYHAQYALSGERGFDTRAESA